jgi:long-subunit fatty acid transport protein
MAQAGGWADSTLGTGFMYDDGSSAEISFGKVDYKIKAESALNYNSGQTSDVDVIKDSSKTSVALKVATSDKLAFGLTSFRSGSIQMQGGAGDFAIVTFIPDADATLNTLALMGTYSVNDSFDVLFGLSNEKLSDTSVSTIFGDYEISGASTNRPILGASYAIPGIALRVSATYMPKASMTASSSFIESHETAVPGIGDISFGDGAAADTEFGEGTTENLLDLYVDGFGAAPVTDTQYTVAETLGIISGISNDVASYKSKIGLPETLIIDFQTGIAADTLLFESITHAKWSGAQIVSDTGSEVTAISTEFKDTTAYSLGLGRKLNDNWSISASYSEEKGVGSPSGSLFTVSNGTKALTLGAQYTRGDMTITGGVNMTEVGGVIIKSDAGKELAKYNTNRVTGLGLKIAFAF